MKREVKSTLGIVYPKAGSGTEKGESKKLKMWYKSNFNWFKQYAKNVSLMNICNILFNGTGNMFKLCLLFYFVLQ